MRYALAQAELGLGRTAPNPAVGCVILDLAGRMVGAGYHVRAGADHAEVMALKNAGAAAAGGTLYVTLEPCSHWGRTPPCADAIIRAGVARVIVSMMDPDDRVSGQGLQRLRAAGVEVLVGPGALAARRLNEAYLKFKRYGFPFVLLKTAMTLDGRIATRSGDSRWVTSRAARAYVQQLRDQYDAVMVGVGTVLRDDPALTVRPNEISAAAGREPRSPVRVILDSRARTPPTARVLSEPGRCVILCSEPEPAGAAELRARGAEVVALESRGPGVDFRAAMHYIAEQGLHSVMIEGGPRVSASAMTSRLVDRWLVFIAPKLVGDVNAPGPVAGRGPELMEDARPTGRLRVRRFPPDVAVETDLEVDIGPPTQSDPGEADGDSAASGEMGQGAFEGADHDG
jgi:diaminohydroxyphosphoribosylaminopyrimidine deaminase / 5-amino-6-(5-phosphoribosylamino)uracil reductase